MTTISVIGLGFVGSAIYKSFQVKNIDVLGYDKYKDGGIGNFEQCLQCDISFLALPTLYDDSIGEYNKSSLYDICDLFDKHNYKGLIVIKSTVEPETTDKLCDKYQNLNFVHNPEFLTARTAYIDFHNQTHIVLGKGKTCSQKLYENLIDFYKKYYPKAHISECTSTESESMKSFVNSFYSVKIQFFNELYLLCKENNSNYDIIKEMMIKNNWINPMHTDVPGPDGKLSYGGSCFPKDTNALCKYMDQKGSTNKVLKATIMERNEMRNF